jgi:hypothetical protein
MIADSLQSAYSQSRRGIVICRKSDNRPIHDEAAAAVVGNPGILRADPSLEVRYDSTIYRIRPSVH